MNHAASLVLALAALGVVGLPRTAVAEKLAERKITGQGVRFSIPANADRGKFTRTDEGQWRYRVKTNVRGLGHLTVIVEPRGDPESTLKNELIGVEANARSVHMKRSRAHVIDINRSKGGEALETTKGSRVAHVTTWSGKRQFELTLEATGGVDPTSHPVWKRLVASFRSDEPPLSLSK